MFTGIIECTGKIIATNRERGNLQLTIASPISGELQAGQSVNHDGVCLTITSATAGQHDVTVISESLNRSRLGQAQIGEFVNLERSMKADGRFDGHIVQGHVDDVLDCLRIEDRDGSKRFYFNLKAGGLIVEKGSVCLNGVSLTVSSVSPEAFSVDVIPFTMSETTFGSMTLGAKANVEYDIIGKYVGNLLPRS
jgi:riboflavin synthase